MILEVFFILMIMLVILEAVRYRTSGQYRAKKLGSGKNQYNVNEIYHINYT